MNSTSIVRGFSALLFGAVGVTISLFAAEPQSILFTGGRVMDGTGNPPFPADVFVRDGKITAVGRLAPVEADTVIDAGGKLIVPGFIDLHSHADDPLRAERGLRSSDPDRRSAPNLVTQGITTVVVNQDGRSAWPIADQKQALESAGVGPNVILLIGHGTVRSLVMGPDVQRAATPEEVERMEDLVRRGMEEGAYGLSAGLEYPPGRWSRLEELIVLVSRIVPYGGVYISHQRSEGSDPMWWWPSRDATPPSLLDAVRETIEIGRRTGATVVASHIKAKGAHYWGSSAAAILLIERARRQGVQIYADQYPYETTGSDGQTVLIPHWVFSPRSRDEPVNFAEILESVLEQPEARSRLQQDVEHEIARRGGADRIVVFECLNRPLAGKSLAQLGREWELSPVRTAVELQFRCDHQRPGGARLRGFSLHEEDIERYARQVWTATASDAGIALPGDGPVHARFYGTFPRKIRRYALDREVITLEHAIRSMTSLPSQILGLRDRGLVREGFRADLVVLDLGELEDRATFLEPHQPPSGIEHVLVGGEFVVRNGNPTGALPGRVLGR